MEQPKKNNKNQKNQFQKVWPPKFNIIWIYIVLLGAIAYMWSSYDGGEPLKTEWFNVKEEMAASGDVEKIIYVSNQNRAEVYIKKDSLSKYAEMFGGKEPKFGPQFYFIVSSNFNPEEQFQSVREQLPEENRFDLETEERTNYFGKALEWLLFPLIIVALWIFMFRRMNKNMGGGGQGGSGGIFSVGKSQAKLFDKENNTKVTFKDVAGLEEAKVEVMEIVD
ncbi:MAG: peptidase M41, partial [Bacteroidia bacterium]|nr:peptidase M41 [Bacteroidia bacterium]